jgi:EmrB/QacA subfamily drug resistance transporter
LNLDVGETGARRRSWSGEPEPSAVLLHQPWHPWLIVGLVCIGAFVGQLDATIVQLALPTLGRTFAVPLETVSWVALGYLVAFAAFLPIFGRLCQMFGRKSLYLLGYLVFMVATALCGAAQSMEQLIAFRVLQGAGGAMLGANSIAILVKAVDGEKRARALGFFAAAQAIGMSAGPALGGLMLGAFGWRWVFWLSIPFGLVAVVLGWLALPRTADIDRNARFDWRGALLIGPAIALLMLALNQLAAWGPLAPATLGCLVGAALLAVLLVRHERACAHPLVDLRLFARGAFSVGALAVLLGYAMLYGLFFLMSFLLEHGYADRPLEAGLKLAAVPVALGLVASFTGGLAERFGARVMGTAGMAVCLAGLLLLGFAVAHLAGGHAAYPIAFALIGAGLGLFIAPNNHATLKAAPAELSGQAGAMLNLMRVLGTSFGVATATSTLSFGIAAMTGVEGSWLQFAGHVMRPAVEMGLMLLGAMVIAAALACALRPRA